MERDDAPQRVPSAGAVIRQVVVPRANYAVVETWEAVGLTASASHDVVVSEVFVPDDHVTDLCGAGLRVDTPLFRLPLFSRLALDKVGVATASPGRR